MKIIKVVKAEGIVNTLIQGFYLVISRILYFFLSRTKMWDELVDDQTKEGNNMIKGILNKNKIELIKVEKDGQSVKFNTNKETKKKAIANVLFDAMNYLYYRDFAEYTKNVGGGIINKTPNSFTTCRCKYKKLKELGLSDDEIKELFINTINYI